MVAIVAILAGALSRLVVNHLYLGQRLENGSRALNLAKSATAQAVAELIADQGFGTTEEASATVRLEIEGGLGLLTFSEAQASALGISCSTNNLESTTAIQAPDGKSVRGSTVRLLAQGRFGGVTRTVESVIEIPQFPWAVAAGGKVSLEQGVLIGSLPEGVWPPVLEDLLPADVVSNSDSGDAVILARQTTVLGDVETPGRVQLGDDTVLIEGAILEGAAPLSIPLLDASQYDPLLSGLEYDDLTSTAEVFEPLTLMGVARSDLSLSLPGGLILQKAQLFVDGDLWIQGTLEGEGVLVVTGDLTLEGLANLEGATKLALLADGRVSLQGRGPTESKFRVLVFCGQGVEVGRMTLVGSLVAGQSGADVRLSETYLVAEKAASPEVSKEFYIGTLDPNNPRYHDESVSDIPPPSGSLLRLKFWRETEADYPVEVEFQYRQNPPYFWTIANAADTWRVQTELSWLLDDWTEVPRDEWVETILDRFPLSSFTEQITSESATSSFGSDLSHLIPVKDRIRMISCFEH